MLNCGDDDRRRDAENHNDREDFDEGESGDMRTAATAASRADFVRETAELIVRNIHNLGWRPGLLLLIVIGL